MRVMAWCRLEESFHDDLKWDLIADASGTSRVTVKGHAATLYSWCVRHAPDGCPGHVPDASMMRVMEIEDRKLFDAFVAHKVLFLTPRGYVVNGYEKRSTSYNEAKRKRNDRRSRPGRVRDLSAKSPLEKRGEERRRDIDQIAVTVVTALRDLLKAKRGLEPPSEITAQSKTYGAKIAKRWPADWSSVLEFFVSQETEGLKRHKWPIGWLVKYADDYDTQWRNQLASGRLLKPQRDYDAEMQKALAEKHS